MAPDPQSTNKNVIKISGKEITRKGVEAFVFIHLDGWSSLPADVSLDARNDLFRIIMSNVWKSLIAGGQPITKITTCMEYPHWATGKRIEWQAPVDFVFQGLESAKFDMWSDMFVPPDAPIVVATVIDNTNNSAKILKRFEERNNILAVHELVYRDNRGMTEFAKEIFSRDPEGTIEIKESTDKTATMPTDCQDSEKTIGVMTYNQVASVFVDLDD